MCTIERRVDCSASGLHPAHDLIRSHKPIASKIGVQPTHAVVLDKQTNEGFIQSGIEYEDLVLAHIQVGDRQDPCTSIRHVVLGHSSLAKCL